MLNGVPMSLIDRCIGEKIWILMKGPDEINATLQGFDQFGNLVLKDAVEYAVDENGEKVRCLIECRCSVM